MTANSGIVKEETMKFEEEYDEPMDINETPSDTYFEEGEIYSSGDEKDNADQAKASIPNIFTRNLNKTPKEGFVTGFNIFEKDEAMKKLDRAKRFALPIKSDIVEEVHQEHLSNLYRDLGIDKENERHYRFNTIHMRGTENMSTEDVLEYFVSYAPSHVEWINDVSCNIVWMDDVSAARALLNMSKRITNLDKVHLNADPFQKDFKETDSEKDEVNDDDSVDARKIKAAIPPGFWRLGKPSDKSTILLMRFATRSDKKQKNAEKNSEYYKKYGNPNFGNIPGILSKSLRTELKKHRHRETGSIWERSRENADQNNPWGDLAYEWGKTDKVEHDYDFPQRRIPPRQIPQRRLDLRSDIPDLRISLTNKKEKGKRQRSYSESSPNSSDEWESKSKIPRMKMYADDEEKKVDKSADRRQPNPKPVTRPVEDLRSKINRKKNRTRLRFKSEKQNSGRTSESETSESENEYDDGDSGDWALEHYQDLRQSLEQNKKHENKRLSRYQSESESDDNDYYQSFGRRSPLQIQIENDEYYQSK